MQRKETYSESATHKYTRSQAAQKKSRPKGGFIVQSLDSGDLAGFWQGSYHEVKKSLKGRYPKHHWPDDPLNAGPTARAKDRNGRKKH